MMTRRGKYGVRRPSIKASRRTVETGNNNVDAYPEGELANPASAARGEYASPLRAKPTPRRPK